MSISQQTVQNHRSSHTGMQKSIPIQKNNQFKLNLCVSVSHVVLLDLNRAGLYMNTLLAHLNTN